MRQDRSVTNMSFGEFVEFFNRALGSVHHDLVVLFPATSNNMYMYALLFFLVVQVCKAVEHWETTVDSRGLCAKCGGHSHHPQDNPPPRGVLPRPPHFLPDQLWVHQAGVHTAGESSVTRVCYVLFGSIPNHQSVILYTAIWPSTRTVAECWGVWFVVFLNSCVQ